MSWLEKLLGILSNGFILLILGTLLTSLLVPNYQRKYENNKRKKQLMEECLSTYLLYTNSIWEEYFLVLPLIEIQRVSESDFIKYLNSISKARLKRYEYLSKVKALSVVFRKKNGDKSDIENKTQNYADTISNISWNITRWLRSIYCLSNECSVNTVFSKDSVFADFKSITNSLNSLQDRESNISNMMVEEIQSVELGRIF